MAMSRPVRDVDFLQISGSFPAKRSTAPGRGLVSGRRLQRVVVVGGVALLGQFAFAALGELL